MDPGQVAVTPNKVIPMQRILLHGLLLVSPSRKADYDLLRGHPSAYLL